MFAQNKYFIFTTKESYSKNSQLITCLAQLVEAKEKFVRTSADFENYKKRMQREQAQWFDLGQTKVLTQLVNIVDDFDRALTSSQAPVEAKSWFEGFELTRKSLQKLLESFDVKEISADLSFDPELHEALVSVEDSGRNSGDVVEILQKGYMYKDKVLRPAKVSVAK